MESSAETNKVLAACKLLNSTPAKMTPKRFLQIFVESNHSELAYLRRLWAQPKGIASTMGLINLLWEEVVGSEGGRKAWTDFVQEQVGVLDYVEHHPGLDLTHDLASAQAIEILVSQEPPRGNYPRGSFHSSVTVNEAFFASNQQEDREKSLTEEHTPFMYNLINGMLRARGQAGDPAGEDNDAHEESYFADVVSAPDAFVDVGYGQRVLGQAHVNERFSRVCSIWYNVLLVTVPTDMLFCHVDCFDHLLHGILCP
jgi:hypothetical protein